MVSIMIGSVIFKTAVKLGNTYEQIATHVFLIASLSLGYCALSTSEVYTFAAFNIFEICCGCYFPTMGTLRSRVVPEASRATVMNVFRFPLNLIVVVALLKVESLSASVVFTLCAVLNLASFLFARRLVLALKG